MHEQQPTFSPSLTPPTSPGELKPRRYWSPVWLWGLTLAALGAVVYLQRPEPPDTKSQALAAQGMNVKAPEADPTLVMAKIILGMKSLQPPGSLPAGSPSPVGQFQQLADGFVGWEPTNPWLGPIGPSNPPIKRTKPYPAADRFRASILAGESLGAQEMAWRLDNVEASLAPESPLHQDLMTVRQLYGIGNKPKAGAVEESGDGSDAAHELVEAAKPEDLDAEAVSGLKSRHGLFAELALSRGNDLAPARLKASGDGVMLVMVMFFAVMGALFAGLAGLVLLVLGVAFAGRLKPRFVKPTPETEHPADESMRRSPGSVWLETLCVFVLSFLGVKGLAYVLAHTGLPDAAVGAITLLAQGLTAVTIFWPLLRGMSFDRWKRESGWHAPRGVLREIGAGVLAYIAAIPVYFCVAIAVVLVTLLISKVTGGEPALPENNRVTEMLSGGGLLIMLVLFVMATVWAPVVEESIFRGALYRHMRRRWNVIVSAAFSALVFAVLHGYVVQGLLMVGALGAIFAVIREWRGSLIACVTAHCLHNSIVMTLMMVIMGLAG